uniref:hypothetical protein n=1 Tax=Agathobacter sp. TaxID=2021311 RepID=UPI00405672FA
FTNSLFIITILCFFLSKMPEKSFSFQIHNTNLQTTQIFTLCFAAYLQQNSPSSDSGQRRGKTAVTNYKKNQNTIDK